MATARKPPARKVPANTPAPRRVAARPAATAPAVAASPAPAVRTLPAFACPHCGRLNEHVEAWFTVCDGCNNDVSLDGRVRPRPAPMALPPAPMPPPDSARSPVLPPQPGEAWQILDEEAAWPSQRGSPGPLQFAGFGVAALGFVLLAADLFTFFAGELSIDGYGDLAVANNLALLMAAPLPVAAIIAGLFVGTARPKGVG